MEHLEYLRFSDGKRNAKLAKGMVVAARMQGYLQRWGSDLLTISVPAGWTCKAAHLCHSWADPATGRITDGPHMQYRCFAASTEAYSKGYRLKAWHNHRLLSEARAQDGAYGVCSLIADSLIDRGCWDNGSVIRVWVGGDYDHLDVLYGWLLAATLSPKNLYYGYTKMVPLWLRAERELMIPDNYRLVMSRGGSFDHLIDRHHLRQAIVVQDEAHAQELGLVVDHDDAYAAFGDTSFALLLHGTQPGWVNLRQEAEDAAVEGASGSHPSSVQPSNVPVG